MYSTQQYASHAIKLASQYADLAPMKSSALLCLDDARSLYSEGRYPLAFNRAYDSLRYSVGTGSPIYQQVTANKEFI